MQSQRIFLMFLVSLGFALSTYMLCTRFFAHSAYIAELQSALASLYMWIPGVFAWVYMKKDKTPFKIFHKPTLESGKALMIPVLFVVLGIVFTLPFARFSTVGIAAAASQYHLNFAASWVNIAIFVLCLYGIAAVVSVSLNFFFALGEELFWRGYLWELLQHRGFWRASLHIGLLWGLWHAPMIVLFGINYPQHRLWGVVWMIVCCMLMTPMFVYLRMKDKSLMAPTILHGMLNAFSPICVVFFPEASELLKAPLGLAGMLALLVVNGYLFLHDKRAAFSR